MTDECDKAARLVMKEMGNRKGYEYLTLRVADAVRGGDADAMSYWRGVMQAFTRLRR